MTKRDLNSLPLDELAFLPEWMVPASRKSELIKYKARKKRGLDKEKTYEEQQEEIKTARLNAGLKKDGSKRQSWEIPNQSETPATKYGPKGGRYTESITREGRQYRRYF